MTMIETGELYALQTWLSPSFPVGAYTYSHGLENAFENGLVTNVEEAVDWIGDIVSCGNGFADAVFLHEALTAIVTKDEKRLAHVTEYATAFCGTQELRLESEQQGAAFVDTVQAIDRNPGLDLLAKSPAPYPYAVALGAAAGGIGIAPAAAITAYLHALVGNLSSALVRIIPLGQTDGQRIITRLKPVVETSAAKALETAMEDVSTATLMVDLSSMQHETQYTRLFRS